MGEANRFLTLFTKELGLIRASAQGIRQLRSKLRFGLQEFALAEVVLVRGREIWRITNAVPGKGALSGDRAVRFGRVGALLRRLVEAEVSQPLLFDLLLQLQMLLQNPNLSTDEAQALETITVMRTLSFLGYFSPVGELESYIENKPLSEITPLSFLPLQSRAIALINQSLSATQL
mgnify:CR=1 FL=1